MANQTEMGVLANHTLIKVSWYQITNGIVKERLAQDDIKETGFPFWMAIHVQLESSCLGSNFVESWYHIRRCYQALKLTQAC